MTAVELVQCLAGEHLADPAIIVETIKENPELWATVKRYGKGETSYEVVSAELAEYI